MEKTGCPKGNLFTIYRGHAPNVTSPGWPKNYPNEADSCWQIVGLPPTDVIRLEWTKFNTEANKDLLRVYGGNTTAEGSLLKV